MTGKLVDLLGGTGTFHQMLMLVTAYVVSIGIVQVSRYFKRFYVRRFANNVNRHMKQILYGTLVRKSRLELEAEGTGNILTKAILDVDDCVEGMRKFTTEIFDTGVALLAYACMLLWYDWRLALLCMIFPPISYVIAEKMKVMVQKTGAAYKVQSGALSAAPWTVRQMPSRIVSLAVRRTERPLMRRIFRLTNLPLCAPISGTQLCRRFTV